MDFPGLKSIEVPRGTLLVLKWGPKSSIHFSSGSKTDIYVITNPKTFLSYISNLFEQNKGGDIVVVTVFDTFPSLIRTLKFLSQFTDNKEHYRTQYVAQCQHQLNQIQSQDDNDIEVVMAEGQYDLPLALRLVIVLDPRTLSSDHLAAPSVVRQQYLRLISYKHGGSLLALANLDEFLEDPESIYEFELPLKPIYEVPDAGEPNGLRIILHIPSAWDSWSKMILLGKSVIFQDNSKVVLEEKVFREVTGIYTKYFEELIGSAESDQTLSKFLSHIENTPSTTTELPEIASLSFDDILRQAKPPL